MLTPGTIALHVIAWAVPVASVKAFAVGLTLASPVIVTVPVEITSSYLTAVTLASALTVTVPVPNTSSF